MPATGCTEPIAIAFAAATMRDALGGRPERMLVRVSGNILKNAKSVVVPGTGGRKGHRGCCGPALSRATRPRLLEVIDAVSPANASRSAHT